MSYQNWLRGTPITMHVAVDQARIIAQQYLNINYSGTTVGQTPTYYGYYTMQIQNNGSFVGMMGINGVTGQVMYYTWCRTLMRQIVVS